MKHFVTVLLISSAAVALFAVPTASSRTIFEQSVMQLHEDAYVQSAGFHAGAPEKGWSIKTRLYKPRSTEPTGMQELFQVFECRLLDEPEAEGTMYAVSRFVRSTRGVWSMKEMERMHLTVEKKIFVGSANMQMNLTA